MPRLQPMTHCLTMTKGEAGALRRLVARLDGAEPLALSYAGLVSLIHDLNADVSDAIDQIDLQDYAKVRSILRAAQDALDERFTQMDDAEIEEGAPKISSTCP